MTLRLIPIALVLMAGLAFGQQPAKKEAAKEPAKPVLGSLEDTLDKALRNSADIKAAEAKIREAEAEANRVRHQVLTRATTLHTNLNVAKRMVAVAEEQFAKTKVGVGAGSIPHSEFLAAQSTVEKARGEVELLETELKSLRGEFAVRFINPAAFSADVAIATWDLSSSKLWLGSGVNSDADLSGRWLWSGTKVASVQSPMAERVRKLLDQEVECGIVNSSPALAMHQIMELAKSDIPLRQMIGKAKLENDFNLNGKLSVGSWFQAIEDSDPNLRVVIRDYGLLMTTKDKIPDGAVRVAEFWKAKEAKIEGPTIKK